MYHVTGSETYRENMFSASTTIPSVVMGIFAIGFLYALIDMLLFEESPAGWGVAAGLFGMFVVLTSVTFLLGRITVILTACSITVATTFGHHTVSFGEIESYRIEESEVRKYRGTPGRTKMIDGRKACIYTAARLPVIVVDLRAGKYRQLAFSSRNPELVLGLLSAGVRGSESSTNH